jgi:alpha/beta superfamily hydrolase
MLDLQTQFPLPHNPLFIAGPAGQLEAIVALSSPQENHPIIAIICHPHPLYGGSMSNKVITTLARAFYDLGLASIRFNFRGIGKSAGNYGEGVGEIEDLLAVLNWARTTFPGYKIWLAGFSFGAYVATSVAAKEKDQVAQLVTIAPAVTHFDFQTLSTVTCPWLLVMGEADEIVAFDTVKTWLTSLPIPITTIFYPGVGHFFHGHLVQLREDIKRTLQPLIR